MGLVAACQHLRNTLMKRDALTFFTYRRVCGSEVTSQHRQLNANEVHIYIPQAQAEGLIKLEPDATTKASVPQPFSIRKWFLALFEAFDNSINIRR